MKKIRGKRRYFRELWETVKSIKINPDNKEGYNYKHFHLDFYGYGNYSVKMRKEHITAHIELCKRLREQLSGHINSFQCWVTIDMDDASADAVYLHTENSTGNPFPNEFEGVNWDCGIPSFLTTVLDKDKYCIGHFFSEYGEAYIIKPKEKVE
ncbi:hypothetical protein P4679_25995 [Priestia megaterium]|uniref:hypothetical protein n=1 Tax=Priestia megaterium TaxID=1404 RepID=UPI002E208609|nr:hypothetical protein [Priestia megaterium]